MAEIFTTINWTRILIITRIITNFKQKQHFVKCFLITNQKIRVIIGRRVRFFRKLQALSQDDLAKKSVQQTNTFAKLRVAPWVAVLKNYFNFVEFLM